MPALAYFTFKDLWHDRWRSLFTVLSLAVVMVGYLLLASLSQALAIFSRPSPVTNNLLVFEANTIDPQDSSLDQTVLQNARAAAPDQVRLAFPVIFRHLTIDGHILQVRALTVDQMSAYMGLTLLSGSWPGSPRQVVASEGAARLSGWSLGSTIDIYGQGFTLTGLVRVDENAFGSLWISYADGQALFETEHGFQCGFLVLAPGADPNQVRLRLLADPRISANSTVYLETAYNDSYNQSNNSLLVLSYMMVLVSLLAVTFGIYNATSLSLSERSLEIGLLRLIGFDLARVRTFLAARALLLTLAAYGLGWLAADLFIARQQSRVDVDIIFLSLRLTPLSGLAGLGLALAFACFGVWLTSRRLARRSLLAEAE